jgi:hypothetical protein
MKLKVPNTPNKKEKKKEERKLKTKTKSSFWNQENWQPNVFLIKEFCLINFIYL